MRACVCLYVHVCQCECAHRLCSWGIFTECVVIELPAASSGSQIAQLAFAAEMIRELYVVESVQYVALLFRALRIL